MQARPYSAMEKVTNEDKKNRLSLICDIMLYEMSIMDCLDTRSYCPDTSTCAKFRIPYSV